MNIYVGNLSYQTAEDDLREIFGAHGEVTSTAVIRDKYSDQSKGFGFVEMSDDNGAKAAIEALDGTEFMGRQIKVNEARPREERGPRGGGGGDRGGGGRRW
jgi:RNA recognition motif-containing protein